MFEQHVTQGMFFLEHHRYQEAVNSFGMALVEEPDSGMVHAHLAACYLNLEDSLPQAYEHAAAAIAAEPDMPYGHYILAMVYLESNRIIEAHAQIDNAIALDPSKAPYRALKAHVYIKGKRYKDALAVAKSGLELDPEDEQCRALYATCLNIVGDHEEAAAASEELLKDNPDSDDAHATRGYVLLKMGKHQEAKEHFREALRISPTNEFARSGMVSAMQASNIFYRLFLKYLMFMQGLGKKATVLIIGFYIGIQILNRISEQYPEYSMFFDFILYAYLGFVLMSWFTQPLFDFFFAMSKYGRMLIPKARLWRSLVVGLFVSIGLLICIPAWIIDLLIPMVIGLALVFFAFPLHCTLSANPGTPQKTCIAYLGITVLLLGKAIYHFFANPPVWSPEGELFVDKSMVSCLEYYFYACAFSTLILQFIAGYQPKESLERP